MDKGIWEELAQAVGAGNVLTDPQLRSGYEQDISGRFRGEAAAVLRPADTAEAAATLAICARHGLPVIPQGGNTGLVGGGVPRAGGVVLSLARLKRLEAVEPLTGLVVAGAGVTLAELQRHACAAGLEVPIDLAARDSATLGGMAATDAGGQLALRHGTMRAQVAGLEAVLADGTILERLGGPAKDNAGYDLSQLIVGSEGTLAIITAVRIRLIARPRHRVSALCGVAGIEEALLLLEQLRKGWGGLEAADFFETRGLELLMEHRGLRAPLQGSHGAYLVADLVGDNDPSEALLQILDGSELECETTAGQSTSERAALWAYRELLNEAVASAGVPRKFDVSVPVAAVAGFAEDVHARVAQLDPDARVILYGHLGDGNVHVNVLGAEGAREAFDEGVLALAASYGGSISAEHGVGVAKAAHLPLIRSPGEIEAMRAIKRALDPHWILNPGCVLAAPERDER